MLFSLECQHQEEVLREQIQGERWLVNTLTLFPSSPPPPCCQENSFLVPVCRRSSSSSFPHRKLKKTEEGTDCITSHKPPFLSGLLRSCVSEVENKGMVEKVLFMPCHWLLFLTTMKQLSVSFLHRWHLFLNFWVHQKVLSFRTLNAFFYCCFERRRITKSYTSGAKSGIAFVTSHLNNDEEGGKKKRSSSCLRGPRYGPLEVEGRRSFVVCVLIFQTHQPSFKKFCSPES